MGIHVSSSPSPVVTAEVEAATSLLRGCRHTLKGGSIDVAPTGFSSAPTLRCGPCGSLPWRQGLRLPA
jgi:hypothetical protein